MVFRFTWGEGEGTLSTRDVYRLEHWLKVKAT